MDVSHLLDENPEAILGPATDRLSAARLPHYDRDGEAALRARLERLFDVLRETIVSRRGDALATYAEGLAEERFDAEYGLFEVQTAINALEEAAWMRIVAATDPADLATALGLVSTALGLVKDAVARRFVALASGARPRSLDLGALFSGT